MANSSPSEEHVDAMEATAAGQDAWSEDYYWDSNYGCWVYFEQWDNQHESWNYFVHDGWDVRTGQQCNGVSTDFSIIGIMQCIIFLLEMSLHCSSLLIGYANFVLHQFRLILIFVSQYFAVSADEFTQPFSVHGERHFAEEGDDRPLDIRYNGSDSSESYVRYNGSIKKTDHLEDPKLCFGRRFSRLTRLLSFVVLLSFVAAILCENFNPCSGALPKIIDMNLADNHAVSQTNGAVPLCGKALGQPSLKPMVVRFKALSSHLSFLWTYGTRGVMCQSFARSLQIPPFRF